MFPAVKSSAVKFPASKTARFAVAGGVAAASVLLLAGPASAHVSVSALGEAAKGGSAVINFKVPNERDNATTTKVEVNIPADHPLASVMAEPIPGWKIDIVKTKLAKPIDLHGSPVNESVSKVTWTADAKSSIPAGQFQLFPLSVSPLPTDTDQLVFKAIQTYSNKEVVRWIEEPKEGAAEPENPAPVLKLTAAAAEDGHGGAADNKASDSAAKQDDTKAATTAASSDSDSSDNLARVLGIVGIVVGIAGVAFGVLAGRRRTA